MTRRGTPSAPGAADWPLKAANVDDWVADGPPEGAADGPAVRCVAGAAGALPPPLGGRSSRMRDPHLWHTVAVMELRVPQTGHGFEPIFRISSSSPSQSSNVRKVGCLRHPSWNSVSVSLRPRYCSASHWYFRTTSSYSRRIFAF